VHNLDYWTSGSQKDCLGKLSWCSLDRPVRSRNLSWAASSDGDCVSVKYKSNATSTFTKTTCEKQLPFICEVNYSRFLFVLNHNLNSQVHNKGTFAQALQQECMDVWDVSIGTKFQFKKNIASICRSDLNSGHAAFRHQRLQRLNHAQKFKGFATSLAKICFKNSNFTVLHQMHWRKFGLRMF
jgi:hypothetical protein